MKPEDIKQYGITYFTVKEIEATGAKLKDVQARLIQHLDRFRGNIGQQVYLIKNGLTTGVHKSELHGDGLAVDFTMKPIEPMLVLKAALDANIKGIGLYWRNGWVSVHLDLRSEYGFWRGIKRPGDRNWKYLPLVEQPQ